MSSKSKPTLPTQDPTLSNHQRHVLRAAERAEAEAVEANADKTPMVHDRPPAPIPFQTRHLGIKTYKRTHPNASHAEIQAYKDTAWSTRLEQEQKRREAIEAAQKRRSKPFISNLKQSLGK